MIRRNRIAHRILQWTVAALGVAFLGFLGFGAYLRFQPGALCPSKLPRLTQEASWVWGNGMPTPRSEIAVASADDRVYVSGGIGLMGSMDSFEAYNTVEDRWTRLASLPTPLHHHGLAVAGDRVYAAGGYTDLRMSSTAAAWSYDPKRDVWERIADLPGPRAGFVLVEFDGGPVAVGGVGKDARALWQYNPGTNSWKVFGSPLPSLREHHGAVVLGKTLHLFGGRWKGRNLETVEIYDSIAGRWQSRTPMPTARSGISVAVAAGKIHVIGGKDLQNGCVFDSHEVYDPLSNSWQIAPPAPTGRHGLGAVGIGNRLLVFGGARRAGIMTPLAVMSTVEMLTIESTD